MTVAGRHCRFSVGKPTDRGGMAKPASPRPGGDATTAQLKGVVIPAYVSSLTPGNYAFDGGYTTTPDGTHHEFGGNGAVVADQFSGIPISVR